MRFRRGLCRRDAHPRHRRAGALARPAVGAEIPRLWRVRLRHLRRLLLSRQRGAGDRRRQYRGRGGAVPDQFRIQGHAGAPARQFARREDFAGPAVQASEDRSGLGYGARRRPRRRKPAQSHPRAAQASENQCRQRAHCRRYFHRHRPCAGDRTRRRPGGDEADRLHQDRTAFDGDLGARPVRRRRRRRRGLSPGRHCRRPRLHGGAGSRTFPRRACGTPRRSRMSRSLPIKRRERKYAMDWDKLKVFHAAAEAGSFTHAGEQLGLSQSAVSRQVSALEQELSVSLFHRHARGLILTEQGELLFRTAHDVFMQLQAARAKLTDSRERPSGDLKITTTPGVGINWLIPRLGEFTALYPEIRISLIVTDEELDLSMREADVAIRTRKPTQPDLIQRKLFAMGFHAYCSPEYIKRFGTPRTLDDLDSHRIIMLSDGQVAPHLQNRNWLIEAGRNGSGPRESYFKVNNILGLVRACQQGLGIAALPDYLVEEKSGLVQLFGESDSIQLDTYFVYPEELKTVARVQVFRDFVVSKAQRWPS